VIPLKDDNPTRTVPFVTVAIIAVNVAVFVRGLFLLRRRRAGARWFA
jgi:hypothetical protein